MTNSNFKTLVHSKIENNPVLMMQQVCRWRHREYPMVFVSGSFEDLNADSIDRLAEIASQGARLIIALRSDDSIRRYQNHAPRKPQHDRAMMMASMTFVSLVTIFDDETPAELIRRINPDIVADYHEEIRVNPVEQITYTIHQRLKSSYFKINIHPYTERLRRLQKRCK